MQSFPTDDQTPSCHNNLISKDPEQDFSKTIDDVVPKSKLINIDKTKVPKSPYYSNGISPTKVPLSNVKKYFDCSDDKSSEGILKVHNKRKVHTIPIVPNVRLIDALNDLFERRLSETTENLIATGMDGTILDLDTFLTDLATNEIKFRIVEVPISIKNLNFGDRYSIRLENDNDTFNKIKTIIEIMRDEIELVSCESNSRKYENCFSANDAVRWMTENLKISVEDALDIGKFLQKRGYIRRVTRNCTFPNSHLFRFSKSSDELGLNRYGSHIKGGKDDFHMNAYIKYWNPSRINYRFKDLYEILYLGALASYLPNTLIRRFFINPKPISVPDHETFYASILFADISGFTSLCEILNKKKSRGVELLSTHLNNYFGQMINLIYKHGGDIVKFAGDALLAIFPTSDSEAISYNIMLAAQCALNMQNDLHSYDLEGHPLTLHVGIGAGKLSGLLIGGDGRIEFLIAGQPMEQVVLCEKNANSGEVYISIEAAEIVKKRLDLTVPVTISKKKKYRKVNWNHLPKSTKNFRLERVTDPVILPPHIRIPFFPEMKDLVSSFLQPVVLGHINSGSPDHFLAEVRNVSVIFVKLDIFYNNDNLNHLQECFVTMQKSIDFYQGTVRQFIIDDKGSVLIAAFGLPPLSHEDDPWRAVQSAISIRKGLIQLAVRTSIGVTTGKAFCGAVGSEKRREYAVVGDIVNLSSRLMSNAEWNILCDKETFISTKSRIKFDVLPLITVKGKEDPIEIFRPTENTRNSNNISNIANRRSHLYRQSTQSYSLRNLKQTLIGREYQMNLLKEALSWLNCPTSENDNARFIHIEGEIGIGKSFLITHFVNELQISGINTIFTCSYAIEANSPYFIWQDVIFFAIENFYQSGTRGNLETKSDLLLNLIESTNEDLTEYIPLLQSILPIELPIMSKICSNLSGEARAEKIENIILKLLDSVKKPLAIIFDNAQWMDSSSWHLILMAVQKIKRILVITLGRTIAESEPLELSELIKHDNSQRIKLMPLVNHEIKDFVSSKYEVSEVPPELVSFLYEKSEGNLLLLTELLESLVKSGNIRIIGNECKISAKLFRKISNVKIPNILTSLITEKIDKLSQNQQLILKVSSVIGQAFEINLLEKVLSATFNITENIENDLNALEEMDLIEFKTPEPLTYAFKQNVTQEVIYDLMLYRQKQGLHKQIAMWYELNQYEQLSTYSLLAYHYRKAEILDRAIFFYSKSGELTLATYANREAVTFFTEALELQERMFIEEISSNNDGKFQRFSQSQILAWKSSLGQALYNLGLFFKANSVLENSLKDLKLIRIKTEQDSLKKIKKFSSFEKYRISKNYKSNELDLVKKKQLSSNDILMIREQISIYLILGNINYYNCNQRVMKFYNLKALKRAEALRTPKERCEAYGSAILTFGILGKHDLVEKFIKEGLDLCSKFNLGLEYISIQQSAGIYYTSLHQWSNAESAFENVLTEAKKIGNSRRVEEGLNFLAASKFLQGKIRESQKLVEETVASAKKRGDIQSQILASISQARDSLALGQLEKVLPVLEFVQKISIEIQHLDISSEINLHSLLSLNYIFTGDFELAYRSAETVLKFLDSAEPTCLLTFSGYMIIPEVFNVLLQNYTKIVGLKLPPSIIYTNVLTNFEKSLKKLEQFSKKFTFAEPRLILWKGMLESFIGKTGKATDLYRKSLGVAQKYGMLYDQGMALFHLGKNALVNDGLDVVEEKVAAYDKAIDIFTNIGAYYTESSLRLDTN